MILSLWYIWSFYISSLGRTHTRRFPVQNTEQEYSLSPIATASRQPILCPLHPGCEPGPLEWWINNIREENGMEEALIQYISLFLIVTVFHSSPPSFQTAGIVTHLQQFTCSEERGVTLLGLISPSLHKLHCSASLSITWILLQVSSIPRHGSLSSPRQPTTMNKDSYSIRGQQENPASRTAA